MPYASVYAVMPRAEYRKITSAEGNVGNWGKAYSEHALATASTAATEITAIGGLRTNPRPQGL
jgi:hypothetical protein